MDTKNYYLIRIKLIGDHKVGKSSLIMRYSEDFFTNSFMPTIGVDFKNKMIEVDGKNIKL